MYRKNKFTGRYKICATIEYVDNNQLPVNIYKLWKILIDLIDINVNWKLILLIIYVAN